ncbi:mechanosensitive ion channel domain-containing protein [Geitlerinema sp. PCC 9228]|uniref:mechanosensitive ion channel family protein n=1 Tax=Geitlerinema sp. PCC 9228 TaxID=111611 RepID=UPI001B8BB6E4|nr:mechanosensitive ion channel domain-containing protein [Geitlerinema sp. PCC 9228]
MPFPKHSLWQRKWLAGRRWMAFWLPFVLGLLLSVASVLVFPHSQNSAATASAATTVPQTTIAQTGQGLWDLVRDRAASQPDEETSSPVILDGRQIFRVTASGQFTAEERAELITSRLEEVAISLASFQVEIEERNQLPTILVNDRYLLTVTERDAQVGRTPEEQARAWTKEIRFALRQSQRERSGGFLRRTLLLATGIFAAAIAASWLLKKLWENQLRQLLQSTTNTENSENGELSPIWEHLLHISLAIARLILWVSVIFYIANLFPWTRQWSYRLLQTLNATFAAPILTLGQTSYSLIDLLILVVLLVGLVVFASRASEFLRHRVLAIPGINRGAQELLAILTKYGLIFLGTVILLQVWGLDLSSITILASALGVGIGFGLQDIAKNFGSGLVLMFERPIQVGDFVAVGDYIGTVERIGARSTTILTIDRISIIVPNSRFLETEVTNWSYQNPVSRYRVPVGVAYGSDTKTVRQVLLDAAKEHPNVLSHPEPTVLFKGFGNSSLDFELLVWCGEPTLQYRLKSDLYFRIEELLNQNHIEIPFPQRDLHVRSGNLPVTLSSQLEETLVRLLDNLNRDRWENGK